MSERDIVERLQAPAYWISGSSEGHDGENEAPLEAADEILRLRAELADAKRAGWIAGRDAARLAAMKAGMRRGDISTLDAALHAISNMEPLT